MARPKVNSPKSKPVMALLDEAELEALDTWRFERRIGSRSAAIRKLLAFALENWRDEDADGEGQA